MTDQKHEYDPDLPYVVEGVLGERLARFTHRSSAHDYVRIRPGYIIIDTTPQARVPEDAKFITWPTGSGYRWFAERTAFGWEADDGVTADCIEDLPSVTPDTVFTVLDERKNDD